MYRYSDWFLLACVVLPWAVEQYDAALLRLGEPPPRPFPHRSPLCCWST
ncbi:hypothetical protein [Streptomyces sp. NPDC059129]